MRIQGLGVIEDATVELHPGLTVLTGETGAGKTLVVTGLTLLGGGRADASRVAEGAARAVVEGRFALTEAGRELAEEVGAEPDEDGSVIAARTIGVDGRSRAHLGGRSVPVGVLARLASSTLAVHGQNDQLRLRSPTEQRALLDRYAGATVTGPLAGYRAVRAEWLDVGADLRRRTEGMRRLAQEADLLRHGLAEIAAVDPLPGEDAALAAEAHRLAAADDLRAAASAARDALSGGSELDPDAPGAVGLVAAARHGLGGADDPELTGLEPRLAEVSALLADAAAELTGYLQRLDADPQRLDAVLSRQVELRTLTRKYAADADGVLAWARQARERLDGLDTSDAALAALADRHAQLAAELTARADTLSGARRRAADRLAKEVTAELGGLAMPDAELRVWMNSREPGPDGVDDVELRLVPHAGAPELPLHRSASGGELSRVMLALEVVLAGADPVPTMVFDEVDAGIGGRAAVEVGRRLARLAASHQVIVVTHLPQVAAYADRHLVVDKTAGSGRVRPLPERDRIAELARMLAGLGDSDTGRAHAEELLATAAAERSGRT